MTFWTWPGCFERLFVSGIVWVPTAAAFGFGALRLVRIIDLDGANLPLLLLALSAGLWWLGWKLYGWNALRLVEPHSLPQEVLARVPG